MYFKSKREAEAYGKKHCPNKVWDIRVWNNLGWHVSWRKNFITVYCSSDNKFHALITEDPNYPGCGMIGPEKTDSQNTVLAAAQVEATAVSKYVKKRIKALKVLTEDIAWIVKG